MNVFQVSHLINTSARFAPPRTCCGDAVKSDKTIETGGGAFDDATETEGCKAASSCDRLVLLINGVDVNAPVGNVHCPLNNSKRVYSRTVRS